MTKIIAILTSLMFMVGCEKEVSSLQERNGVYYEINSEKGFTGNLIKKYPNGQKMSEGHHKDGKREGIYTDWYENGKKQAESNYKDGKHEGLATNWGENGQKEFELNYKDGKPEGLVTSWYGNGQKKYEGNYKDGELIRRQK